MDIARLSRTTSLILELSKRSDWDADVIKREFPSWILQVKPGRIDLGTLDTSRVCCYEAEGKIERIESTVELESGVEKLSPLEYEDLVDCFFELFESYVEELTEQLGEPIFCDGAAAKGFPEGEDAVWLALWRPDEITCSFMLQQRHEDRELPFRICLVSVPC